MSQSRSHIYVCDDFEDALDRYKQELYPSRVVSVIEDDFLLEHSKKVVKEAYISESETKYIIFGAHFFRNEAQNSLLKILEEPPKNIVFIIFVNSKSVLLPTIISRLQVKTDKTDKIYTKLDFTLNNLELSTMFYILKNHSKYSKREAKLFLEDLMNQIVNVEKLTLSLEQAEAFETAYKLIDVQGKFQNILIMILNTFLRVK